jgi:hypothetical protein
MMDFISSVSIAAWSYPNRWRYRGPAIGHRAGQAVEGWVGNIAGGAVGGAILMILVGLIKDMTSK